MGFGSPGAAAAPAGFRSLIEQATAVHDAELGCLRLEVERLRQQLRGAPAAAPGSCAAGAAQEPRGALAAAAAQSCGGSRAAGAARDPPQEAPLAACLGAHAEGLERVHAEGQRLEALPVGRGEGSRSTGTSSIHSFGTRLDFLRERHVHGDHQPLEDRGCLWRLANSDQFELVVILAIVVNGLLIAAQAQYTGFDIAEDIGYSSKADPEGPASEIWPHAELVFGGAYWFFGVFFSIEILIKIVGLRGEFFHRAWNWLDLFLVLFWVLGSVFNSSINPQILRSIRLIRVFRLVRLLKFMRGSVSDSSFIILTALRDSLVTSVWAILFFFVVHYFLALVINEALVEFFFFSESHDDATKNEVFVFFGSFTRSFLTVFELTFANWVVPARTLSENVSGTFTYYAILHRFILGFAAAGVVGAVFIQETFQVVQQDDAILVRQALRREKAHAAKMRALFDEGDKDGSGTVTQEEFQAICGDKWVQIWLRAQEIKSKDISGLFELLDDGDGQLTAEELVKGTAMLKGTSAIITILRELRGTSQCVREIQNELLLAQRAIPAESPLHL